LEEEKNNLGISYYNLAQEYISLDQYAKAADALRVALRWNPSLKEAVYNLGLVLAREGAWEDSQGYLLQLLQEDPENTLILKALGYLAYQRGDSREAVRYYDKAFEVNPFDKDTLWNLFLLEKEDSPQQATAYLKELRPFTGLEPDQLQSAMGVVERIEAYDLLEEVSLAAARSPEDPLDSTTVLLTLGRAYEAQEKYSEAISLYSENYAEGNGAFLFARGRIYLLFIAEVEAGFEDLQSAVEAGFSDREAFQALTEELPSDLKEAMEEFLQKNSLSQKEEA